MIPAFSMSEAEKYMGEAVRIAETAYANGEVPVGCVIVSPSGEIIAKAANTRENSLKIHGHAEINCINAAAEKTGSLNLSGCSLFVTLEPCPMCAGAISEAGISAVYFGAPRESGGIKISYRDSGVDVYRGILGERCGRLVTEFFKEKVRT